MERRTRPSENVLLLIFEFILSVLVLVLVGLSLDYLLAAALLRLLLLLLLLRRRKIVIVVLGIIKSSGLALVTLLGVAALSSIGLALLPTKLVKFLAVE